jgi:hypothetical protein
MDRMILEEQHVMVEWLAELLLCVWMVFIAILKSWGSCVGRICVVFLSLFNQSMV